MSNIVVGEVYRQIMERILQVAKNDFEEGGYAPDTLNDLQSIWQENLSKLHVAHMPWDPKPVPPSNIKQEADSTANGGSNNVKPDVKYENQGPSQPDVKFENQGAAAYASMNGYAGGGVNPMAQQRAANNLIQQFGSVANASAQAVVQQPRSTVQNGATNPASQASESDAKPNVSAAQTDGAGDVQWAWQGTVDQIRDFEAERPVADGFFRSQMDATDAVANAGLMLNTAENRNALKKLQQQQAKAARRSGIPQVDGPDEEDEDAINSDLDDSEDEMEQEEDDDEGPLGEMILCTWDKVNRVKNKWKCTLKDGVLATGGKEYLFLKATGEFEW